METILNDKSEHGRINFNHIQIKQLSGVLMVILL